MITGAAAATVYYNLKLRHPAIDMPIIDYDLALLFQPMLVLGISIGVAFNVIFADWMITVLLIILFFGINHLNSDSLNFSTWRAFLFTSGNFLINLGDLQAFQLRHSSKALRHGKKKP